MLRDQLRRVAAAIAAANDEDLLRLSGDDVSKDAVQGARQPGPLSRQAPSRQPARRTAAWHHLAHPAPDRA